jgi:heme exporter protein C
MIALQLPPLASLPLSPGLIVGLLLLVALAMRNQTSGRPAWQLPRWEHAFGWVGLCLAIDGQYLGLVDAPRERMMGEVGRILYVHVPSAWSCLVCFSFAVIFAVAFLMTGKRSFDLAVEATAEVGVILCGLLLVTGSTFARPTWGTWWTWDPRLTSSAVMMIAFVGVLLLRQATSDPDRRATWTSVASILAGVSMVVTYMSVRWWRSIHQMQSSPDTIAPEMTMILRINGFAFLFLAAWMIGMRYRLAALRAADEEAPPLPPAEVPT